MRLSLFPPHVTIKDKICGYRRNHCLPPHEDNEREHNHAAPDANVFRDLRRQRTAAGAIFQPRAECVRRKRVELKWRVTYIRSLAADVNLFTPHPLDAAN